MANRLENLLERTILWIETPTEVGTGFFISQGHLLTCAHVVADNSVEDNQITCFFQGHAYSAKVTNFLEGDYPDLAVLAISLAEHDCLRFSPEDDMEQGKDYLAQGFQRQNRADPQFKSDTVTLKYEGPRDREEQYLSKFEEGQVSGGMSGAPVLDEEGNVVAVIKRSRDYHSNLGADAIPASVALSQLKVWGFGAKWSDPAYKKSISKTYNYYFWSDMVRLVATVFILMLLILWFQTHLGSWYATFIFLFGLTPVIFKSILANHPNPAFQNIWNLRIRRTLKALLQHRSIGMAGIITILLWLFVSSIRISTDSMETDEKIEIFAANDRRSIARAILEAPDGEVHFLKWINPFGKRYSIVAGDYDTAITLTPFQRADLDFPSDFELEPLLYIRLPYDLVPAPMTDQCLLIVTANQQVIDTIRIIRNYGAVQIGLREADLAKEFEDDWEKQLKSLSFEESLIRFCLDSCWNKVQKIKRSGKFLKPGTQLVVNLFHHSQRAPISTGSETVTDKNTDLLLITTPN